MLSAALALVGALVYGSADFLGGLAARRVRAIVVTAVAAVAGMLLLLALTPVAGGAPDGDDLLWGALSGVSGAAAVGLLYGCLALGPMSVLSPVTAVVSAAAPVVWGLVVGGERRGPWSTAGMALAIVAIVLVALIPGEKIARPSLRGFAMAVGSGLAIGVFLIMLDQIGDDAGLLPLALGRGMNGLLTGATALFVVVAAARAGRGAPPALHAPGSTTLSSGLILAAVCGLTDATANLLLLLALRSGGDLSVVAALTALYPAGTVLLAAVVLRERIAKVQIIGMVGALGAGILLAVG